VLLDLAILFPYFAIAIWSNSLTLIGEVTRGSLLLLLEIYLLILMRRIHRRQITEYEYGTGSLEMFGNLAVGLAMMGAALWMVANIAMRWDEPPEQSAGGLWLGFGMTTLNLLLNAVALRSVWLAGRDGSSIIVAGLIRARLSKTISSVVVVVVAAVNGLLTDRSPGTVVDLAGAAFVVCVMVSLGVGLCRQALPSLVDQTLDEARQVRINQVLAGWFEKFDQLDRVRSRQLGGGALVEIHLGFDNSRNMGEVQRVTEGIAAEIRALIPGAEVLVVPYAISGQASSA
jgi:divalent metal cation (Fe/Co/Zn/Cd) transporter